MADAVNLTNLREMTEGDVEMEKALFEEFCSSAETCIAALEANCADGENEVWRSNAHALKGTSLNLGAEKLGVLCKQAQEGCAASQAEKQTMLSGIKTEYAEVKTFLDSVH